MDNTGVCSEETEESEVIILIEIGMEEVDLLESGDGGNILASSFSYDREKPCISTTQA